MSGCPDTLGVNSLEQIIKILKRDVKKEDIILVMGAGKSNLWAKEICNLKI
jgi:UDP-N-acetylmuramate-alanine ligase